MSDTLADVRSDGEALTVALSRELYRSGSGLQSTAALEPIYAAHQRLLHPETLVRVREAYLGSPENSEERRRARHLLEWLASTQADRELAPLDERMIAWEASAVLSLDDGRTLPYQRAPIEIANTVERTTRRSIDQRRTRLVQAELAPMRRERLGRERDIVERLELGDGYVASFSALSGIELDGLVSQCERFLRDTAEVWREVLSEALHSGIGVALEDAERHDSAMLLRGREFDSGFPAASMEPQVRRQLMEMGVDADAGGRIRYDTAEREGKRSRAFCAPVLIPDEVYLVLRPHGGRQDWASLLHEAGHALHFANADASLPFEDRCLGDNSVTEGYAMLLDHLLQDRGWLMRYTELGANRVGRFLRSAGLQELHFLRRYCAKLVYERRLYAGDVRWEAMPDLYVELLTGATLFRYDPADAFVDVDPNFYSARYLRAWQLQSALADTLREKFDDDWWRNPRAGPWLIESLMSGGQREDAVTLAARVTARELDFEPLRRRTESLLTAA